MTTIKRFGLALVVGSALLVLGYLDERDLNEELTRYCEMVEAGAWPDFEDRGDECDAIE